MSHATPTGPAQGPAQPVSPQVAAVRRMPPPVAVAVAAPPAQVAPPPAPLESDEGEPLRLVEISLSSAISMMVHLALLIVLGLIVAEKPLKSAAQTLVASVVEELPNFEQIEPEVVERDVPLGLRLDNSQILADATEVTEPTATGAEVEIDGPELKPTMVASTVGRNGAAFFGAVAKGKKYVFVVDNSNSMNSRVGKYSKFVRAKAELLETISKMTKEKSYYVVFFNAHPTRMFDPEPAKTFIPATKENYDKLYEWLAGVELAKGTRGKEAMQIAIDLKPDAIYVLGDGAFTDDVADILHAMNSKRIPIHTLLFDSGKGASKGRESMEHIAKENGGSYNSVD